MRKPAGIDSDDDGPVIARAAAIDVAKATGMVCTRVLLRDGLSRVIPPT
jgi:hypothetical protein